MKEEKKNILPVSGKPFKVSKPTPKNSLNAERIVDGDISKKKVKFLFAMVAELVEIDGKKIVFEDVLSMDNKDVNVLIGAISGTNFIM